MTLAETLHHAESSLRAASIDNARIEAEFLLSHALDLPREALYARLQEPLSPAGQATFEALLRRRLAHEPSAYIVGHMEFYGLDLACTPAALIPRPETELLIEEALRWVGGQGSRPDGRPQTGARPGPSGGVGELTVVDVGTGNGAIAVALAVGAPQAIIVALDTSRAALSLARHNATQHGVAGRIAFVQGNLLAPLDDRFDIIAANLPYIPTRLYRNLPPELRDHEPEPALHPGRRGPALIESMLAQAPSLLKPGGLLLAEHAWNQARPLRDAARAAFPKSEIETKRDLAGRERLLVVQTS